MRAPRPTTSLTRALISAALLALLVAGCGASDSADDFGEETSADVAQAPGSVAVGGGNELAADEFAGEDAAEGAGGGGEGAPLPPSSPDAPGARAGERIIKEGTVTVQVPVGQFDAAFSQVVSRAQALGGYVAGSSTSTDGLGLVSGQVTVRVPVDAFEDLLTAVGDAGEVLSRDITSRDVSEEFTDLEARRRNLQAQERFYLGLLEDAQTINDAIAVQQQLEGIQTQIEQITGRLNLLEDRSSMSTLTVRLNEVGADGADLVQDRGILARSLDEAGETFLSAIGFLIVVTAGLAPFALLIGVPVLIWLGVRRSRRDRDGDDRPARPQPDQPAGADDVAPAAGPAVGSEDDPVTATTGSPPAR